jgi:hypothetical protein
MGAQVLDSFILWEMSMTRISVCAALLASGLPAVASAATLYGPTPYLSQADSPFNPAAYSNFYLEDFEDGLINTLGLSATGGGLCITNTAGCFPGSLVDSVGNGGDQTLGHSLWGGGPLTIIFSAAILGQLPTVAGLVWTDGNNPIIFEAFDQNGVSLGTLGGTHADGNYSGGTSEDRFYGVSNAGGISKLVINNPPATEIDHVQYGFNVTAAVPEPASWAMMIGGFALVGAAMRRRVRAVSFA